LVDNDSNRVIEIDNLKKIINLLEKQLEEKQALVDDWKKRYDDEHNQLLEMTGKVGNALEFVTQTNLADKLIEGKTTDLEVHPVRRSLFSKIFRR
jgi:predicted RNase H-like nuclease (RuvC/YqgF family)